MKHIVDLGEIEWSGIDWIGLDKDREEWRAFVNMVIKIRVP
jgi:hypothetical protein